MTAMTREQMDALYDEAEGRNLDLASVNLHALAEEIRANKAHKAHALFAGAAAPESAGLGDMPAPRGDVRPDGEKPPAAATSGKPSGGPAHLPAREDAPVTGLEGLEGITRADVKIPALKIRQGTTKGDGLDGVPLGAIFLSFDPSGHAPKRMIGVLDVQPGRGFLMPFGKSNEAQAKQAELRSRLQRERGFKVPDDAMSVCSSRDRKTPIDRGHGVLSPTCATCPYAQWRTAANGKRQPPECGEDYRIVLFDEATETPAVMTVRKTGISAVKNLLTNLVIAGRNKIPPAGFRLPMSTEKDGDGSNDWWVPKFGKLEALTDAERDARLALRRGIVGNTAVQVDDEHGGES